MAIKRILNINNSWTELFNFQNSFLLPLTGTFKNCTITYPESHNNHHILRWYEWDLLVFCKQTPFQLAAIGTLSNQLTCVSITGLKDLSIIFKRKAKCQDTTLRHSLFDPDPRSPLYCVD